MPASLAENNQSALIGTPRRLGVSCLLSIFALKSIGVTQDPPSAIAATVPVKPNRRLESNAILLCIEHLPFDWV